MIRVVNATGEGIVIDCASSPLKPGEQASSDLVRNFELYRASRLLLDNHSANSSVMGRKERPDFRLYQVATAELAVDGEIEKHPISHPTFTVEEEADRPDLPLLHGLLDANLFACVPRRSTCCGRIILSDTHFSSPIATIGQRENAEHLVL